MKTGLVLEGGAFRGLFSAGVLDYLIEKGVKVDYTVGVSAGAGNQMNYVSGQKGRTRDVIQADQENAYFGIKQVKESGHILNLDKMVYDFAKNQFPFDFKSYAESNVECEVVVTNCETGKAEYIKKSTNRMYMLTAAKASCSVPIICSPVAMDGKLYLDGSLADSIPVARAVEEGCDKIFVVLTRKPGENPTNYGKMKFIMKGYQKKYPALYDTLMHRTDIYQEQVEYLDRLVAEGRAYVIRPAIDSISKFERDKDKQDEFYQHGYDLMESKWDELRAFFEM
jgi:predicted patatin/cPLA2 family phospholipase